jgi:hypothetical protein
MHVHLFDIECTSGGDDPYRRQFRLAVIDKTQHSARVKATRRASLTAERAFPNWRGVAEITITSAGKYEVVS